MSLERAVTDYQAKTPRSRQLFEEALRVMPGGNSRTTTFFDPYPFYITRGEGARIWDADGNERLDFNCNYTSLILGHANPAVVKAIQDAAVHGMSFPGPSEHEIRLAEILTTRIPGMEVVRFANSGTEATMHAVRVARAFTGRAKIAKFEGAYHGTHDWVLVSVAPDPATAGSRKRPKSVAWSSGVPPMVVKHVVTLPWNDADACEKILEKQGGDIAALIIDPLLANAGMIPVREGFLEKLREVTQRLGILLIFDEVISFRVGRGGAQERFNIRPDLTTLGKIIGGGLAVGAFGGRADVMNFYDPRDGKGRINHGGTFNANPLTMAGGIATMEQLTPGGVCAPRRARRPAARRGAAAPAQEGLRGPDHRHRLALLAAPQQEEAQRLPLRPAGGSDGARADVPGPGQRGRAPLPARARRLLAGHDRRRRRPLRRDPWPRTRVRPSPPSGERAG